MGALLSMSAEGVHALSTTGPVCKDLKEVMYALCLFLWGLADENLGQCEKKGKTERGKIVTVPNQEVRLRHENLLCGGGGTFTLLQAVGRVMFPEVTAFSGVFSCIVDWQVCLPRLNHTEHLDRKQGQLDFRQWHRPSPLEETRTECRGPMFLKFFWLRKVNV